MFAIEVKKLAKKFNGLTAVDNISFSIKPGEIFGLLGPNGAGKTTTISMLSTILEPTCGTAYVNGYNIIADKDNVRKSIGIVFQDQSLDEELTAFENMDFHGRLYRISKEVRKKKIAELLELVELEDRKDDLVKTFSGGMRRRLEIARGLLHEPKVLFLDEPTLGLDPQTRNHLWAYIKKLNEDKKITIILTTHYMDEADKLCNTVAIIDKGKIVISGTPENLKEGLGGDTITIESSDSAQLKARLESLKGTKNIRARNGTVKINLQSAEKRITEIVDIANKKKISIRSISIHKPSLEDVFLHHTGRNIRDEEASIKDHMRMRKRMWGR